MQKPAYKAKIGSATFDSTTSQEIISISVDLDIDLPSDSFKIALKPGTKASAIRKGDPVIIELGHEETLNKVLTGAVDTIEPRMSEVVVSGLSAVAILTRVRTNQVYEKQTAGAMVKDLAGRAGLAVKGAEEGLSFPMYVVDDTKDVYTHMKELAQRCGFDLFLSGDGRLVFKKYARQTPRPFKFGRDIIEAEINELTPIATCVKVVGESPSSFKGADTSHWSAKKVVEGVAGSGSMTFLIEDPLIRDKDTADKVATARLEAIMTPLSGTLKALGNARVGLGDTIEIKDMPDSRMSGEFEVTSISHIFNKTEGFVSIVGWVKKITISPAEPPLALPLPTPAPPKPPSPLEEQLGSAKGELEDRRMELLDAVEEAESTLEGLLAEINNALAEMDRLAKEMIAAAEDAKKTAMEAAREALNKADELRRELEAKKKEIEDELAEAKAKFEEYKKDAYAQIEKYKQEITKLKQGAEKAVDEAKSKVDEVRKEAEERLKEVEEELEKARGKAEEWNKKAEEKMNELEASKEEALSKTGVAKEKAEEQVRKLESEMNKAKEKAESLEKEVEDKKKEVEEAASEAKKKVEEGEKEIEKEFEENKKEAEEKIKELEEKEEEIKKGVEDLEKELEAKAEDAKKKLEEATKEIEAQIEEAKKTAENIQKEADEKFAQAKKNAEDARKEAATKLEEAKKAYKGTRDKVLEARKQAGLD